MAYKLAMLGARRIFSIATTVKIFMGLELLTALSANANERPALVIPYPTLIGQDAIFTSALLLGRPSVRISGRASTLNTPIPSNVFISGAFPFTEHDTSRTSGWIFGIRTGVTGAALKANEYLSPGQDMWELAIGRGTTEPAFENNTGLRGFMELSLRSERPKVSQAVADLSSQLNSDLEDKKLFFGVKLGAGSTLDAEGLVQQKPGKWASQVQTHIYLPAKKTGGSYLSIMSETLTHCRVWGLVCGPALRYERSFETKRTATFEELADLASLGLVVHKIWNNDVAISLRLQWYYIGNSNYRLFQKEPTLGFALTKSF